MQLIHWLLKPGGKMVFEFGGFGNGQVQAFSCRLQCLNAICRCGVRAALHHAIRAKGIDPIPLDPWYFPTVKQYEKVVSLVFIRNFSSKGSRYCNLAV